MHDAGVAIGNMMPQRPLRSLHGAPALLGMALLVASGLITCGPAGPKPNRGIQARVTDQSIPSDRGSTSLVLRLKERRLDLMKDDARAPVESFPIVVGRAGYETPTGRFHVEEMIEHPDYQQIDPNEPSRVLNRIPPGPTTGES